MQKFSKDIRWQQRFENFYNAYKNLQQAIELANTRALSKLEDQGLIKSFEYTHELAWKVLKDFLEEQGMINIIGSKNATRLAFKEGIIQNGEIWMEMIEARNQTSRSYNLKIAADISEKILTLFYPEFKAFTEYFLHELEQKK
jgi:nucleotidyltransferase substrate binding protein (TIGR01987 family)